MKHKVLVVVDMQHDFIDGALGSPEARAIVPNVCKKIAGWDGAFLFTMDTHDADSYNNSLEGKHIPVPHCILDTPGYSLHEDVLDTLPEGARCVCAQKPTFGFLELPAFVRRLYEAPEEIHIVGLCTDVCVVSNALILRAAFPEVPITVDSSCCAGVSPESHQAALRTLSSCCIEVV